MGSVKPIIQPIEGCVFRLLFSRYQLQQDLFAACLALFIICVAIIAVLVCTPLYALDMRLLGIAETAHLGNAQIYENYQYMIHFLVNPLPQTFRLPTLASSAHGRIHFQDVKRIFNFIEGLMVVCGGISIWGAVSMHRQRNYVTLRRAAICLFFFTAFPLVALLLDFNDMFLLFHQLAFSNNYWIFDPVRDPVINILPETFFMHAALLIVGLIALGMVILLLVWRHLSKQPKSE